MKLSEAMSSLFHPIYQPGQFLYSMPRLTLKSFADGKAFDHKRNYNPQEKAALEKDIFFIYNKIIASNPLQKPSIVVTAGSPGSGKTLLMKEHLKKAISLAHREIAYIDPDDVCLKQMNASYQKELEQAMGKLDQTSSDYLEKARKTRLDLYNKWRPGSNAACHLILANLLRESFSLYFGTTSTSPATGLFFDFLKKLGYSIKVLHISAPDHVRWGSIQARDRKFVQTTEKDIIEKGDLFPQRLRDSYLKYADEIEFYYRNGVHKEAKLAAIWTEGNVKVLDKSAYASIQKLHNLSCEKLKRKDFLWPEELKDHSVSIWKSGSDKLLRLGRFLPCNSRGQ